MKIKISRIIRLSTLVCSGLLAMSVQQVLAQEVGDHQYTSEAIEAGSAVYTQQCALCHGPQGALVDGINLRIGQFRTVQSDADLRQVISDGAGEGRMPAFSLRRFRSRGRGGKNRRPSSWEGFVRRRRPMRRLSSSEGARSAHCS